MKYIRTPYRDIQGINNQLYDHYVKVFKGDMSNNVRFIQLKINHMLMYNDTAPPFQHCCFKKV